VLGLVLAATCGAFLTVVAITASHRPEPTAAADRPAATTPSSESSSGRGLFGNLLVAVVKHGFKPKGTSGLDLSAGLGFDATTKAGAQRKTLFVAHAAAKCLRDREDLEACDEQDDLDLPKAIEFGSRYQPEPGTTTTMVAGGDTLVVATFDADRNMWMWGSGLDGFTYRACVVLETTEPCPGGLEW
jgi:hypothetical protein